MYPHMFYLNIGIADSVVEERCLLLLKGTVWKLLAHLVYLKSDIKYRVLQLKDVLFSQTCSRATLMQKLPCSMCEAIRHWVI